MQQKYDIFLKPTRKNRKNWLIKRYTAKKIALKIQTLLHLQGGEFTKNYSQS